MVDRTLVVIPARGGSKGLPGKNIKPLAGKPLLHYSIEAARSFVHDEHICVTTDSEEIKACAEAIGLAVPFTRPAALATDQAGSYEVMVHALAYYNQIGRSYERLLLLQPTSPFRKPEHIRELINLYTSDLDMVVSVGASPFNPYFNLFEETPTGFLQPSKLGHFTRRQEVPPAYYYNGSLYLINTLSLQKSTLSEFTRVKKYVMDDVYCQDIDTPLDLMFCETMLLNGLVTL